MVFIRRMNYTKEQFVYRNSLSHYKSQYLNQTSMRERSGIIRILLVLKLKNC